MDPSWSHNVQALPGVHQRRTFCDCNGAQLCFYARRKGEKLMRQAGENAMRIFRLTVVILALAGFALAQRAKGPSEPGTAEVTLNGKKISVDYSRPHTHDPKTHEQRKMIGGTEPYGKPWRAGANQATAFVTEADLDVGGTFVPAGSYT